MPSARDTITPAPESSRPKYAICRPSRDQRGPDAASLSDPRRVDLPVATSMIQTCEYGPAGRSLFWTL